MGRRRRHGLFWLALPNRQRQGRLTRRPFSHWWPIRIGGLLAGVARAARSNGDASLRHEAMFLLAILLAAGAAALTWFPAQRPITAIPLLLAAGRAWRVSGPRAAEDAP